MGLGRVDRQRQGGVRLTRFKLNDRELQRLIDALDILLMIQDEVLIHKTENKMAWVMNLEVMVKQMQQAHKAQMCIEDGVIGPIKKKDDTGVDTSQ